MQELFTANKITHSPGGGGVKERVTKLNKWGVTPRGVTYFHISYLKTHILVSPENFVEIRS